MLAGAEREMRRGRNRRHGADSRFAGTSIILASAVFATLGGTAVLAQTVDELQRLSIDDLANIQVTSVSKAAQPLSDAAAAVYVITHDDIMRSGAMTLPEILCLAPNLQVAQVSGNNWAVSARGFNSTAADKLLVLIDGRSVYTPLYSGVIWDEKDVLPEDIERIEVISGPGATLWGANAVNGVINIITRKSADTQGGVLELSAGTHDDRASLQYGGMLESDLSYRAYLKSFTVASDKTSTGVSADDGWSKSQTGFRLDWTPQSDTLTFQGDYYHGSEDSTPTIDQTNFGGNFEATWQHALEDGSSLQLLAYYDGTRRELEGETIALDTYDIELQHSLTFGEQHNVVWGAGYRAYQDLLHLVPEAFFVPESRFESLADVFAQDSISLSPSLTAIIGLKLEDDPYSGLALLPNGRLSWKVNQDTLLWAAVSRAVRAPTRFDTDLREVLIPSTLDLQGNPDFQSEKLTAYEIGARAQPNDALSLSISTFYNVYDDLRSFEVVSLTPPPILLTFGNMMEGDTYGVEMWGTWRAADWWQLNAGFNLLHEALRFKPGSSEIGGIGIAGDDPNHQASLRSTINLLPDVVWEADLREIGKLHDPVLPEYTELDSRLAWDITRSLEIAVGGINLLHPQHLEFVLDSASSDEVERGYYIETKWRF
jgi:iron complex outermembrane receptor protein